MNPFDEVVIAGQFRGELLLGNQATQTTGSDWDLFYLIINQGGVVSIFSGKDGDGNDSLLAVEYDFNGLFNFRSVVENNGSERYLLTYLDAAGEVDDQVTSDVGAITNTILDDDDEEPIEDPIG